MEEFINNFNTFKDFLNDKTTHTLIEDNFGKNGITVLNIIQDRFNDLNLNDAF